MPTGTFERFAKVPLSTTGDWVIGVPDAELILGNIFSPQSGGSDALLDVDTNVIYLDGDYSTPIGINDLPPGFTILTARLLTGFYIGSSSSATITASPFIPSTIANSFGDYPGIGYIDISPLPTNAGLFGSTTIHVSVSSTPPTTEFNELIIQKNNPPIDDRYAAIGIIGTYETQSFSWTLTTPPEPVHIGSTIKVTSDPTDPNPIDFTEVETVTIVLPSGTLIDVPSGDWTTIETNLFEFLIPDFAGEEPTVIDIEITSTEFSGSVTLGRLITIYFLSASGLYRLIPAQRHDELYIEEIPGDTIAVKIPNPSFRTGFIGG